MLPSTLLSSGTYFVHLLCNSWFGIYDNIKLILDVLTCAKCNLQESPKLKL